jgi:hypothetical protein
LETIATSCSRKFKISVKKNVVNTTTATHVQPVRRKYQLLSKQSMIAEEIKIQLSNQWMFLLDP